jgi:hypothetical protein
MTIVPHDAMMPSADRSSAMLNASDGTTMFNKTPATVKTAVSAIPSNGTPCFVILAVNAGALPFIAIDRRMRPVEYSPALRLDSAAVSTTKFMMSPAAGTPIDAKKVTNGLVPCLYAVYGSSSAKSTSDPT